MQLENAVPIHFQMQALVKRQTEKYSKPQEGLYDLRVSFCQC